VYCSIVSMNKITASAHCDDISVLVLNFMLVLCSFEEIVRF
jgi:hypothetical protein